MEPWFDIERLVLDDLHPHCTLPISVYFLNSAMKLTILIHDQAGLQLPLNSPESWAEFGWPISLNYCGRWSIEERFVHPTRMRWFALWTVAAQTVLSVSHFLCIFIAGKHFLWMLKHKKYIKFESELLSRPWLNWWNRRCYRYVDGDFNPAGSWMDYGLLRCN